MANVTLRPIRCVTRLKEYIPKNAPMLNRNEVIEAPPADVVVNLLIPSDDRFHGRSEADGILFQVLVKILRESRPLFFGHRFARLAIDGCKNRLDRNGLRFLFLSVSQERQDGRINALRIVRRVRRRAQEVLRFDSLFSQFLHAFLRRFQDGLQEGLIVHRGTVLAELGLVLLAENGTVQSKLKNPIPHRPTTPAMARIIPTMTFLRQRGVTEEFGERTGFLLFAFGIDRVLPFLGSSR